MNNITEYASFQLWFIRENYTTWNVFEVDSEKHIGQYKESLDMFCPDEPNTMPPAEEVQEIRSAFQAFKEGRPEYGVGAPPVELTNPEVCTQVYDDILLGCLLIRARRNGANPDKAITAAMNCIEWLHSTDFYVAPASTQYHESFAGGLCYHTLRVYYKTIELLYGIPSFYGVKLDSAVLVALTHDWCKINLYEVYQKNVKDEATGQWHKEDAFRHKGEMIPLGHGVQSLYLVSRFARLSPDEACALRWHMGAWRVVPSEMNDLQKANETYPIVHLVQFADQLSIVNYA